MEHFIFAEGERDNSCELSELNKAPLKAINVEDTRTSRRQTRPTGNGSLAVVLTFPLFHYKIQARLRSDQLSPIHCLSACMSAAGTSDRRHFSTTNEQTT